MEEEAPVLVEIAVNVLTALAVLRRNKQCKKEKQVAVVEDNALVVTTVIAQPSVNVVQRTSIEKELANNNLRPRSENFTLM